MKIQMPRLRTSEDGRFINTVNGSPFFWLGDTAWELFHRLNLDQIKTYLSNRRKNGFSLIQVVALAEFDGLNTPNAYGYFPFINNNPKSPHESYWGFVDKVITLSADYGLYVGLLPTWGDKVADLWGTGPIIFDEETAYIYGSWLGKRYCDYPNIVWILGGDRPPVYKGVKSGLKKNDIPIWREMATGIREGDRHSLFTYHPSGGHSSSEYLHQEAWLDLNMMQSGHGSGHDVPVWDMIGRDYQLLPEKPTLDGEPNYEDHPVNPWPEWDPANGHYNDYDVRKQIYRSVFAGGCGVTYGHHSVWQFCLDERVGINHPLMDWQQALDRPGATQVRFLRNLMESRPYLNRVPDQSLLVDQQLDRSRFSVATRDDLGSYAFIYLPVSDYVTVNLARLDAGQVNVWWFNPQTGIPLLDGKYSAGIRQTFEPPGGGKDWVLVIDSAQAGYSPPGVVESLDRKTR
jgi:hypothetical protein